MRNLLALRDFEVLPAEEMRINGPRARTDHCQAGTQGDQHDWNPLTAGARTDNP